MALKSLRLICIAALLAVSTTLNSYAQDSGSSEETAVPTLNEISYIEVPDGKGGVILPPEIESDAGIIMDAKTGQILYSKNINKHEYPASITKIMTTLLAAEYGNFDEIVTFSHHSVYSIEPGGSIIGMREGEQITLWECVLAIMMMSANEVSTAVAEHIGGSEEGFVEMMNLRAKELGCTNTNFANPHGLHHDNHYTTAYDMALIMKAALENENFQKVIDTYRYQIQPTNKVDEIRYMVVQHEMVRTDNNKFMYPGSITGKTGYTDQARSTLVTVAEKEGVRLITVVLKTTGTGKYKESIALMDYGFNNFEYRTLVSMAADSYSRPVTFGDTSSGGGESVDIGLAEISPTSDMMRLLPKNADEADIKKEVVLSDELKGPVFEGQYAGGIKLYYGSLDLGSMDLLINNTVEPPAAPVINITEEEETKEPPAEVSAEDDVPNEDSFLSSLIPVLGAVLIVALILVIALADKLTIKRKNLYTFKNRFK